MTGALSPQTGMVIVIDISVFIRWVSLVQCASWPWRNSTRCSTRLSPSRQSNKDISSPKRPHSLPTEFLDYLLSAPENWPFGLFKFLSIHVDSDDMAQPFTSRSAYTSGKLADRSLNSNPIGFGAPSLPRHRMLGSLNPGPGNFGADGGKSTQQPPPPPAHSQDHAPSQESANPLNRLTEEQREEINEAVRDPLVAKPKIF
jgi:hypothetical protein